MDILNFRAYADAVHISPSSSESRRDQLTDVSGSYVASPDVLVSNDTDVTVYVATGKNDVVAKNLVNNRSSTPVFAGTQMILTLNNDPWVATRSNTSPTIGTVSFTPGKGA